MGFMSLAGDVRRFMGRRLYLEYRKLCPMEVGDVHLIDASPSARQEKVLLACTMILPGTPIPVENVSKTSRAILRLARDVLLTFSTGMGSEEHTSELQS